MPGLAHFAAILVACLAALPARAATDSNVTEFNARKNTAKTLWSYRAGDANGHDGNYTLLTSKGTFAVTSKAGKALSLKDWDTSNAGFTVPLFVVNMAGTRVTFASNGQQIVLPGKTMLYHPGNGFPAVLSFLVSTPGTAAIAYDFTHLDWSCGTGGGGINWSIEKNSGQGALASGHLLSPTAQSIDSTGPQSVSVAVAAGDRINFIVDGVDNPPNCDSTGLAATITAP